jgi:HEPN domain-containing protein
VGWLDFIAAVVSAIAWPVAIVVVVLLLRRQIRNLIPLLRRIRYGEFEAEFSEEVEETAAEIQQHAEEMPVKELPALPEDVEERLRTNIELLRASAQENPGIAVLEAWLLVEFEVHAAAIRNNIDSTVKRVVGRKSGKSVAGGINRILRVLADRERIPEWVVDAVNDLRVLRSEVAQSLRAPREPLSTELAVDYVNSVERILEFLARA